MRARTLPKRAVRFLAIAAATGVLGLTSVASAQAAPLSRSDFRNAMRKLWEDHITWTRLYIVSATADLPDKDATTQRLLQNQTDIGNAIKPFYGDAAGTKLTALLKDHILIAADLVAAAKVGDTAKKDAANANGSLAAGRPAIGAYDARREDVLPRRRGLAAHEPPDTLAAPCIAAAGFAAEHDAVRRFCSTSRSAPADRRPQSARLPPVLKIDLRGGAKLHEVIAQADPGAQTHDQAPRRGELGAVRQLVPARERRSAPEAQTEL
jgi:hypothetical protein